MSAHTSIEWTDRTWNPVRGCSIVSSGCTNCYAMKQAHRFSAPGQPYAGLTRMSAGGPVWTGRAVEVGHALFEPLGWAKPARVFVNSMSDLFHEDISDLFIADVFAVMAYARHHTFQVLTKRPGRMARLLASTDFAEWFDASLPLAQEAAEQAFGRRGQFDPLARRRDDIRAFEPALPLANVWLGVSVEDQLAADMRIPEILRTPAAVRWISAEPLLGAVDCRPWLRESTSSLDYWQRVGHDAPHGAADRLDWVVCGGESGPGSRPMHPDWARSLRDQCQAAGVPFFFKQWGDWQQIQYVNESNGAPLLRLAGPDKNVIIVEPGPINMIRAGKRATGRELDGRTWDEFPEVAP